MIAQDVSPGLRGQQKKTQPRRGERKWRSPDASGGLGSVSPHAMCKNSIISLPQPCDPCRLARQVKESGKATGAPLPAKALTIPSARRTIDKDLALETCTGRTSRQENSSLALCSSSVSPEARRGAQWKKQTTAPTIPNSNSLRPPPTVSVASRRLHYTWESLRLPFHSL